MMKWFLLSSMIIFFSCAQAQFELDSVVTFEENFDSATVALDSTYQQEETYYYHKPVDTTLQRNYVQQSVEEKKMDRAAWEKATKDLDYTDHRKQQQPDQREYSEDPSKNKPVLFDWGSQTYRVIAFVLLFGLLIFILLKAFGFSFFLGSKKGSDKKKFSIEDFDEHIPETELERFLREALLQKNYRLAVRIYYLMVIKELSTRSLIRWKKEKTNFDYLMELNGNKNYQPFKSVTLTFERIWYGDRMIDENTFGPVSSPFKNFLSSLRS